MSRLEAQGITTTEISEYENVFRQRHLRNELQCCTTRCEFNPDRGEHWVCQWCDSMQGNRSGKPGWRDSTKRLMVDAERLSASCDDVGDLMHPAGPQSGPSVPESVFQIPHLLPTDSARGVIGKRV